MKALLFISCIPNFANNHFNNSIQYQKDTKKVKLYKICETFYESLNTFWFGKTRKMTYGGTLYIESFRSEVTRHSWGIFSKVSTGFSGFPSEVAIEQNFW